MALSSIRELPLEVREEITDEKYLKIEQSIYDTFDLDGRQIEVLSMAFKNIVLGRYPATDLLLLLSRMPGAQRIDLRALTLEFALKRFWPISFFLKDVDMLITRLGGRVPSPVQPPMAPTTDDEGSTSGEWERSTAREMLLKNRQYHELYLTQKPMHDAEGRLKAPSVSNWLADYLHVMGAEGSDTLKRSQYLAKSKNAERLNDAEKKNILNFLFSYENDTRMYWRVAEGNYILVETELPEEEKTSRREQQATQHMSDLLAYYADIQRNYEQQFARERAALAVEAGGNMSRLGDIIWDALGVQNADRCLAALNMLVDSHALWDVLKTDQRYRGIVARFIDAHYGIEAKTFWGGDVTTSIGLALLWRIMFVEKLQLEEGRAAILADYFSKKLAQKTSPMYLDLQSGKFIFREISYKDRQLSFM